MKITILAPDASGLVEWPTLSANRKSVVTVGVFDGTEPQAADAGLKVLADPKTMIVSDPQIALLRVQRAEDDTVLEVIQQLHGALDNAAVIGIRKRAVTIGVPAAVTEWLKAHPLT